MKKEQLIELLKNEIARLKTLSYQDLLNYVDEVEAKQVGTGKDFYQIEIQAFFDDKKKQYLRVVVNIDDGGWRAFFPLTDDFIIIPTGEFI